MKALHLMSLGQRKYAEVLQLQKTLRLQRIADEIDDTLITVEHPRVITRGRRPSDQDFRVPPSQLEKQGFDIEDAGRGGRLTYHGPGQLVAYFIFSLKSHGMTIPVFVRHVEEGVIQTLQQFKVDADRRKGCPGVWINGRKIASIGLSIDRGVSMHGVALNIDPELKDFEVIVPCGITDCEMTSMQRELESAPSFQKVEKTFQKTVRKVFSN